MLASVVDTKIADGISYGVILGLMVYASLIWWTFRDRIDLCFILASAWTLLTLALLNGHLAAWLEPGAAELAGRAAVIVPALSVTFTLLFGRRYLYMRRDAPRCGQVTLALGTASALVALGALAGELWLTSIAVFAFAVFGLVVLAVALRPSPTHGYRLRAWYLVTTCGVLITVLFETAHHWALLAPGVVAGRWLQLGIVAQVILCAVGLGQRLPRLRRQQGELAQAAHTDPLTTIANRAGLASRARALLKPSARRALLLFDLDHFKPINDEYGHDAGDQVLVKIAHRLTRITAADDTVARLGGDEFAILLAHPREREDVARFAEAAIAAIRAPIELDGRTCRVSASVGIAIHPDDGSELPRLLRGADRALYQAKRNGRDGYAFARDVRSAAASLAA